MERLQKEYAQLQRKFHKRNEPKNEDYTLVEYWKEFSHIVLSASQLKTDNSIQFLLQLTSDFHDACEAFKMHTVDYYKAMELIWFRVIQEHELSMTDKVRVSNVLKEGQARASLEVYSLTINKLSGN
ncbi:unnamed protein product [Rhizopus stolonifer]